MTHRSLSVGKGVKVGYYVWGSGPTVVLAQGLGGSVRAFQCLFPVLRGVRVISWDYRGMYTTSTPRDKSAMSIVDQARDLRHILEHEQVAEVALVGWSMGVQVALEFLRNGHAQARGLFVINGTAGKAFGSLRLRPELRAMLPALLQLMAGGAPLVRRVTNAIASTRHTVSLAKRYRLIGDGADSEVLTEIVGTFRDLDWRAYSELLRQLDVHDAHDVLPTVRVPTTIITGDRDVLTPIATARRMHSLIAHSKLVVIPGGTHYTPLEHPDIVGRELEAWLVRAFGVRRS